tara:strand:+ start:1431 stop:1667 length:237 start_codon:yes stop_codon:yes gene_type:complete
MYSLFDYYFTPPTRTVYVVSDEQLEKLKLTQKNAEIKEVKVQLQELDNAYNRRKSEFVDTLAALEDEVKKLESTEANG